MDAVIFILNICSRINYTAESRTSAETAFYLPENNRKADRYAMWKPVSRTDALRRKGRLKGFQQMASLPRLRGLC